MDPKRLLRIANLLMPASLFIMLLGAYIGFIDHNNWPLTAQVFAHIAVLLGAVSLKVSYVIHLNASKHLGVNDFAAPQGAPANDSESPLPECCLAGRPCL